MRIARNPASAERSRALEADIASAALAGGVEGRVCGPRCATRCASCGSASCQCACAPYCADAPRMLASDALFPLERGVAPLVFALKRTGFFEPCWSCEGHEDAHGVMTKPPAVWFYCENLAHLRVLSAGLAHLRLTAAWRIGVTYSDPDNPWPTFALEPANPAAHTLAHLRGDLAAIAHSLPEMMRAQARALSAR